MEKNEIELIRRAQIGDTEAFDRLVRLHDRKVLQLAYSILGNLQDAQDLYQETFLRAFSKISSYRFDGEFGGWLGRIAVNLSLNRRKQRYRLRWFSLHERETVQPEWGAEEKMIRHETPENNYLAHELRTQINQSLDALPTQQRAVFALKHLHGYKIAEIAKMLDCAEGTVKNALFRATHSLRKQLLPYHNSGA